MKRIKYLVLLVLCVFTFAVSGCGIKPAKCEHTSSGWIIDKEPTCTEEGSKHKECLECKTYLDVKALSPLDHHLVLCIGKEATCEEEGYEYYICDRADCEYKSQNKVTPALGHDYKEWIIDIEAICNKPGQRHSECSRCGKVIKEEYETDIHYYELYKAYDASDNSKAHIDYRCINCKIEKTQMFEQDETWTIEDNTIRILNNAFNNCKNLVDIEIPDSVTSIGYGAFEGCNSLTSITLPFVGNGSNKTYFGYIFGASDFFDNMYCVPTSLKEIIITGGTSIGRYAFYDCSSLTSIEIPNSVTYIGWSAFNGCSSLASITLPFVGNGSDEAHFGYIFGASSPSENSKYVPSSLKEVIITGGTSIEEGAFYYCSSLTSIVIPNGVTSIGDDAFYGCSNLTSIEIPDSITSIGERAFDKRNNLENVYYKGTIEDWCKISFDNEYSNPMYYASHIYMLDESNEYKKVTEIVIPEAINEIGNYQFCDFSNLTSIEIPNSVTSIGNNAFSGCTSLTSIEIPDSVTSIGNGTFSGCSSLTSVVIPNSVTNIGMAAFYNCSSLTSIEVDSENEVYDSRDNCNAIIETATNTLVIGFMNTIIPSTVTSIGDGAFSGCSSLTSIKIPTSVTSIGYEAFFECSSLTSIEIPNSVTSIGEGAFYDCSSLENVYYKGTIEDWCKISFSAYDANPMFYARHIYMLDEKSEYEEVTEIVIPETITEIGYCQFYGFKNLTNIAISNSATIIGICAFLGCTSLTNIVIPNAVTSIGGLAFFGCSNLTIYCEANSKPEGWDSNWNFDNLPVVWGYKK